MPRYNHPIYIPLPGTLEPQGKAYVNPGAPILAEDPHCGGGCAISDAATGLWQLYTMSVDVGGIWGCRNSALVAALDGFDVASVPDDVWRDEGTVGVDSGCASLLGFETSAGLGDNGYPFMVHRDEDGTAKAVRIVFLWTNESEPLDDYVLAFFDSENDRTEYIERSDLIGCAYHKAHEIAIEYAAENGMEDCYVDVTTVENAEKQKARSWMLRFLGDGHEEEQQAFWSKNEHLIREKNDRGMLIKVHRPEAVFSNGTDTVRISGTDALDFKRAVVCAHRDDGAVVEITSEEEGNAWEFSGWALPPGCPA